MKDLIQQIEKRASEISAYLGECAQEREQMAKRDKELQASMQRAERELRMCHPRA